MGSPVIHKQICYLIATKKNVFLKNTDKINFRNKPHVSNGDLLLYRVFKYLQLQSKAYDP